MPKMKDDQIEVIESDVEKMQRRPTMYIGSLGEMGALHLCKEVIDNNRDECQKPDSPGDTIVIDVNSKELTSRDNGRGIPTNLLRIVHETNQAGSNMTRAHGTTAGENGTGTTAVLAMSSYFEVTTLRPQEKKKLTLKYKDGVLQDEILEKYDGKEHGLITTFRPSKKILGTATIPVDLLRSWLQDFDYTLPKSVKMQYNIEGKPYKVEHKSLSEYFDSIIPKDKRMSPAVTIKTSGQLKELVSWSDDEDVEYNRSFEVEAAVVYSDPSYHGEDIRKSWMNMIYTSQNGAHMNGVVNGLSRYLTDRVAKRNKKLAEDGDLKRDILSHLHVVVRASCDFANMFASQSKSSVFPRPIANAIADAVYKELCDMPQAKLNELVEVVIQNNRVRREGERVRNVSAETKKKQWTKPDSYLPCSTIKTPQPKELFLVEGLSASGGIVAARDARYQAVLMFRGKSLNIWELTIDEALKSDVWFNLVKVLGCGIGSQFDINRLNFDKIIIATDADVDGYHIRVGMAAFFLRFMPKIIYDGHLFIAEPPLYQLETAKRISYVASQSDYIDQCINTVGNISLTFPDVK